jgi:hypothetical protein
VGSAVHPRDARLPAGSVPAALWAAGVLALLAFGAWPFALVWAALGALLAPAWRALRPKPRAVGCALLAVVLVVLTWEGGLFLVPAVLAGLVVSARQFDE